MNLITGATGLIGAHVALQLLQQGKPVTAIRRADSDITKTRQLFSYYTAEYDLLFDRIRWVDADITDIYSILDALEGIDHVYHCAGFVSFDAKDREQMHRVNATGTANMVNACLEKPVKAFCHVSSIATLQNPDITTNISESISWKSSPEASDYAISKYNGEREVWRGMEEGLQAVIVNPGLVLGPGFWDQSSGRLISTCYKGSAFYTSGSSAAISATDTAACMIALTEKRLFGQRFILTAHNYTFRELLSELHVAFGKKAPSIEAGKAMLRLGLWLDALRSAITGNKRVLTKATMYAGLAKNTYNNSRVKDALHYNFASLQETIRFVCSLYLKEQKSHA